MISRGIISMMDFYNIVVRRIVDVKGWDFPKEYKVSLSERYDLLFIGDNKVMLFKDTMTANDYTINVISDITNENVIIEEEEIRIGIDIIKFTWIDVSNIKQEYSN